MEDIKKCEQEKEVKMRKIMDRKRIKKRKVEKNEEYIKN